MHNSNILISSGGRRVGLMQCFRDAVGRRGVQAQVSMMDAGTSAPLAFVADRAYRVPRLNDPSYIEAVKKICENSVGLLVPTIDTELALYAGAHPEFSAFGTTIAVSSPETVAICGDKVATHEWLVRNDFPTVRQTTPEEALSQSWRLPLIAKPRNGSASIGVRRIETNLELRAAAEHANETIVQEIAAGREYTINVYVNRTGECICAVPHWRMEIRGGEVSKGVTVRDESLIGLARRIAEALPGAWGALNIQCFNDSSGNIRVIELNARFGGGYPLAHHAGAHFTGWLLDELEGRTPARFDGWTEDLAMLRYDEAVYVPGAALR